MSLTVGLRSLGDFSITAAGTQTGDWIEDLDGMQSALVSLRLAYGSGGTSIKAYVQSTADDGVTAHDIACVVFGTASEHRLLNFTTGSVEDQITPTDGTMADDTAELNGLLGTKMRLKIVSAGVYAGSTVLSVRVTVR